MSQPSGKKAESAPASPSSKFLSFQDIILKLQTFWSEQGCVILQPWDKEVGAGTFHPATALYALGPHKEWRCAYVQPSRRPTDGRYGEHPNRLQRYYQFQVLLKPAPPMNPPAGSCERSAMELYKSSLAALGLVREEHDLRFLEDDWESPTLGATGLGWEVWCDAMEISQFTYFQQVGGIECDPVAVELTYGLERIAMLLQKCESIFDIKWNSLPPEAGGKTYGDIHKRDEEVFSAYNFEAAPVKQIERRFEEAQSECKDLLARDTPLLLPAYERCLEASHYFNLLDARGAIAVDARQGQILSVRQMMQDICKAWCAEGSKPDA